MHKHHPEIAARWDREYGGKIVKSPMKRGRGEHPMESARKKATRGKAPAEKVPSIPSQGRHEEAAENIKRSRRSKRSKVQAPDIGRRSKRSKEQTPVVGDKAKSRRRRSK